ncbi:MAG TPA: hypothetical protein VFN75_01140, partial [Pseudonocardiaceae bacterium]|nr:hypothetical protein [Pseudonocardiaceae bacterium]
EQVERAPRTVQAVELVASATDSLVALDPEQRTPRMVGTPNDDSEPESDQNWTWVNEVLHQTWGEDHERSTVNE